MSAPRMLIPLIVLGAIIFVACGGGGDEPSATATPPAPTDTPAPQIDVPGRPNAFADYPGVVGIYLTRAGDSVLGTPCLEELVAGWAMPEPTFTLSPEERCLVGNTDDDADEEVVVVFTATPPEDSAAFGILSNTVIFDDTADGYVAVYESYTPDQVAEMDAQRIVAADDVTGDGDGELVHTSTTCGAHTCTTSVHVLDIFGRGGPVGASPYKDRTPGSISMETADASVEDRNADGVPEIVLHGGTINSVGAGPQRTRTEAYGWDGSEFTLLETTYDPSNEMYFAVLDADTVFNAGNFSISAQRYQALLEDGSLTETGFHENELAELSAYALFRRGLALLATDDDPGGLAALQQAVDDYPDTVNTGLAESFLPAYETAADIHGGCLAVRNHIDANLDAFQTTWEYGYANPPFDPEAFCPF